MIDGWVFFCDVIKITNDKRVVIYFMKIETP